jgi:uncharacterized protein YecE (DUF72 family)
MRGHALAGAIGEATAAKPWLGGAAAIDRWKRQRREVFVYFDNDQKAAAPKDAQRLIRLVEG